MKENTKQRLLKEADKYAIKLIMDIFEGSQREVYIRSNTKDILRNHYLAGAEGFVNSIWRDIEDELPKKTDKILILRDGEVVIGTESYLGAFTMPVGLGSKITPFHIGDKWCYADDLLPNNHG
jgi:hypothetical protein